MVGIGRPLRFFLSLFSYLCLLGSFSFYFLPSPHLVVKNVGGKKGDFPLLLYPFAVGGLRRDRVKFLSLGQYLLSSKSAGRLEIMYSDYNEFVQRP